MGMLARVADRKRIRRNQMAWLLMKETRISPVVAARVTQIIEDVSWSVAKWAFVRGVAFTIITAALAVVIWFRS